MLYTIVFSIQLYSIVGSVA